jgi:hypothetical protein
MYVSRFIDIQVNMNRGMERVVGMISEEKHSDISNVRVLTSCEYRCMYICVRPTTVKEISMHLASYKFPAICASTLTVLTALFGTPRVQSQGICG